MKGRFYEKCQNEKADGKYQKTKKVKLKTTARFNENYQNEN